MPQSRTGAGSKNQPKAGEMSSTGGFYPALRGPTAGTKTGEGVQTAHGLHGIRQHQIQVEREGDMNSGE